MALPAVLLKAKNGIKKAAAAGKAARNLSSSEEVQDSIGKIGKFSFLAFVASLIIPIILVFIAIVVVIMMPQTLYTMFGAVNSSESSSSSSSSSSASSVVDCARGALGVPYVWGGTDYENGMDCSGLVMVCYERTLGVSVGRDTVSEYNDSQFEHVSSIDDLVAGDLIQPHSGHVVIYTGKETNTIIHEPHTGDVCKEVSLDEYYGGKLKNSAYAYLHYKGNS